MKYDRATVVKYAGPGAVQPLLYCRVPGNWMCVCVWGGGGGEPPSLGRSYFHVLQSVHS